MSNRQLGIQEKYDRKYRAGYMEAWPRWKKNRIRTIIRSLSINGNVGALLDFGCGRGEFTTVLQNELKGWRVKGADVSLEAVNFAWHNAPGCEFGLLAEVIAANEKFDFIFSHHVLEHVDEIDESVAVLAKLSKPGGLMLHILPSGGVGSLENFICTLRPDGFDPKRGNRMFFEHPDHQRRLTAEELIKKLARHGFGLRSLRYANRFFGSIEWISASSFHLIWTLTDTKMVDRWVDRLLLRFLRSFLIFVFIFRFPVLKFGYYRRRQVKRKFYKMMFLVCFVTLPLAIIPNWIFRFLSEFEYHYLRDRTGSEMYLILEKCE